MLGKISLWSYLLCLQLFTHSIKCWQHPNAIPWLFIDEAGQIPPQYAASAIYKLTKVLVVGDPLQTDPISILKQDLIKLCEHFKVSYPEWSPSEVSLQNLADRNSLYQTKIDDVTVSFPL